MRPCQFGTQRVPNWECRVKTPHKTKIALVEALAVIRCEFLGKVNNEGVAVFRPFLAALLLDNAAPDFPICLHHGKVDGGVGTVSCRIENACDPVVQICRDKPAPPRALTMHPCPTPFLKTANCDVIFSVSASPLITGASLLLPATKPPAFRMADMLTFFSLTGSHGGATTVPLSSIPTCAIRRWHWQTP